MVVAKSFSKSSLTLSSATGVPTSAPYSVSHSVIRCPIPQVGNPK